MKFLKSRALRPRTDKADKERSADNHADCTQTRGRGQTNPQSACTQTDKRTDYTQTRSKVSDELRDKVQSSETQFEFLSPRTDRQAKNRQVTQRS